VQALQSDVVVTRRTFISGKPLPSASISAAGQLPSSVFIVTTLDVQTMLPCRESLVNSEYNKATVACPLVYNTVGCLQPPKKNTPKSQNPKILDSLIQKMNPELCNSTLECPDRGSDDDASQTRQAHVEAYGFQPQIGNRHDIP
jgi:hypothetical protein